MYGLCLRYFPISGACALMLACTGLPYRQRPAFQAYPGLLEEACSLIKLAQGCPDKTRARPEAPASRAAASVLRR